jgi:hypothetical protein
MKKEVNIIIISWELHEFNIEKIKTFNRTFDYGIYQIYGKHKAYGREALLYIGKAEDRTFATRLQDGGRIDSDFNYSTIEPTHIRLGYITIDNSDLANKKYNLEQYKLNENWAESIKVAEKLLIATHPPALNKVLGHKWQDFNFDESYLILNGGDYGDLQPEVSTFSVEFCDFFDNYFLRTDDK